MGCSKESSTVVAAAAVAKNDHQTGMHEGIIIDAYFSPEVLVRLPYLPYLTSPYLNVTLLLLLLLYGKGG